MRRQFRPRLTEEEYNVILAMKAGWQPDIKDMPEGYNASKVTPAKILIFDIETAPLRASVWGLWEQNIQPSHIISDWFMLTWSAKWLFEDKTYSDKLTPKEALSENDKRISTSLWKLIDEADIIIAHNANKFDVKKMNTRFLLNGLNPPMPYQVIDTLLHLRKRFSISSNKLSYVNELLGLEVKMETGGFELWEGCMKGEKESLIKMEKYNIVDVNILEQTYLRIRSWIKPHPNMGMFIEDDVEVCPSCASENIVFGGTPYRTASNSYESFRCKDCGSVGRSKKSIHKHSTTRSIPR